MLFCCLQGSEDEQFQSVLQVLFALAGRVLREGGVLVTWLPFTLGWLGSSTAGAHHSSCYAKLTALNDMTS